MKKKIGAGGIVHPKSAYKYKISHFKNVVDLSLPVADQITERSRIITLQTIKCAPSKSIKHTSTLFLTLEDDINNDVLNYINDGFDGYNDFLIELQDGDMTTTAKIYLKNCELLSVLSELDYGSKDSHKFFAYFNVEQITYLK